MKSFDTDKRVRRAIDYFNEGYNCAQSVFMAYSDLFGYTEEAASAISSSFGGGMGRLRETCGAVSAMALLAGLKYPASDPANYAAKTANYAVTRNMVNHFTDKYGTMKCSELLKIPVDKKEDATSLAQTFEFHAKRPCARFVEHAAHISAAMLKGEITVIE